MLSPSTAKEAHLRILTRYVLGGFLVTFMLSVLLCTFVMCVMMLFRINDYLAKGASILLVGRIFLSGVPAALVFSIPISVLTSTLLTFGKLSAHGETTAMRGTGICMWQIARPPLLFAILLSLICVYLNAEVIPHSWDYRREALRQLGTDAPLQFIDEGRFIRDLEGYTFYFGSKKDQDVRDVIIYQHARGQVPRTIRARTGTVKMAEDKKHLLMDLFGVWIDPFYEDKPGPGQCEHFTLEVDISRPSDTTKAAKNKNNLTLTELWDMTRNPKAAFPELDDEGLARETRVLVVEFHKRLVMSLSCFTFILFGVPLGTQVRGKDSTVGIGISLGLAFLFYLAIITAESMAKKGTMSPELLLWIPPGAALLTGLLLMRRVD